jgi:hypothetical protein
LANFTQAKSLLGLSFLKIMSDRSTQSNISKNGVNVITSLISQLNTPRNIVESGVKHHKPNQTTSFLKIKKVYFYRFLFSRINISETTWPILPKLKASLVCPF